MLKKLFSSVLVAALAFTAVGTSALATHNAPDVDVDEYACGETMFSAYIDAALTHKVDNMYLVVSVDGMTYMENIPTDGTAAEIDVGPWYTPTVETKTISWRVFGGGERDYDMPSWNGYGDPGFGTDVGDYGDANGWDWVVAGPEDTNPFTTWNEVDVDSCEMTMDMCKKGGWEELGFRNQGQCIRYINTGQDSRVEEV